VAPVSPDVQALSIVLPAHNEADLLPELLRRLIGIAAGLDVEVEIVLVDDGSTDASWQIMLDAAREHDGVRAIQLSRNFGHQVALTAGLTVATGDGVITMDSDLQHPPEVVPSLLAKAREGFDVVYAVRSLEDSERRRKIVPARLFYAALNRLTALDLPDGAADFRYMSRRVVDALVAMPERHRFLRGMTRWVGYEQTVLPYRRDPRLGGRSKYGWRAMFKLATDAIVGFSAIPLRMASMVGFLISGAGAMYLTYAIGLRLLTDKAVPGWTSVVIAVLILGGVQLMFIGVIGLYLSRMYDEGKRRPLFLIAADTATESRSVIGG
jgi:dolichol-phosphate mannosyltransferase